MAAKENEENVIFIGNKPPMSYVLAVVTQFNSGSTEVIIKARGRAISRAVDAAEITRNRFVSDAKIKEINIGSESITNEYFSFLKLEIKEKTLKGLLYLKI